MKKLHRIVIASLIGMAIGTPLMASADIFGANVAGSPTSNQFKIFLPSGVQAAHCNF